MPTSEARIRANQANAQRSTGPRTEEGKARSRVNAYQHGLTGAGVVMPEGDAAEVERRFLALQEDLRPPGLAGSLLVRQIATLSVRMERAAEQESAAIAERVRRVMDEFVPPEGADAETAAKLRAEAGGIALFDPSKEACLARRYEAAARRGFFRAISDLRQLRKDAEAPPAVDPAARVAAEARATMARLGSLLQAEEGPRPMPRPAPPKPVQAHSQSLPVAAQPLPIPSKPLPAAWEPSGATHFDVPIAIGRRR